MLFSPDLSAAVAGIGAGPAGAAGPAPSSCRRAEALRGLFQGALAALAKDDNSAATIRDLTDVCEQLVPITRPSRRAACSGWPRRHARRAGQECVPDQQPAQARRWPSVEREIKRLARWRRLRRSAADAADRTDHASCSTYVAHEGSDAGRIGEIREIFDLSGAEPERSRTRACPRQPERPQSRAARNRGGRDQGRPAARQGCARPASAHARRDRSATCSRRSKRSTASPIRWACSGSGVAAPRGAGPARCDAAM